MGINHLIVAAVLVIHRDPAGRQNRGQRRMLSRDDVFELVDLARGRNRNVDVVATGVVFCDREKFDADGSVHDGFRSA